MAYGAIIGQSSSMDGVYETLDRNSMIRIPAGADVNNYITPGVYFIALDDKASVLNLPEFLYTNGYVSAFIVREGSFAGSQIIQEIYVLAKYVKKFIRGRKTSSTEWCDWIEIYSTYNKPTAADVGALSTTGGTLTGNLNLSSGSSVIVNNGTVSIENGAIKSNMGLTIQSTNELTLAPNTKVIDMFGSNVRNVATPTSNTDAANKAYVDQQVVSAGGIVTGTYTGNGSTAGQTINLGFRPKLFAWYPASGLTSITGGYDGPYGFGFIVDDDAVKEAMDNWVEITNTGVIVYGKEDSRDNNANENKLYLYFAVK